jgi:broad specificity phosphatase PhoE
MFDQSNRRLILIRHSVPEIDPGIPASRWHLSGEGRLRCQELGHRLEGWDLARIITSHEPKAIETGEIVASVLGIPVNVASGLQEHARHNVRREAGKKEFSTVDREAFQAKVLGIFENPGRLVYGAETGDQAHRRFSEAITQLLEQYPHDSVGVVTHGTVMALFVSRACDLNPGRFWTRLGLPCYVVLSLPELALLEVVESVTSRPPCGGPRT